MIESLQPIAVGRITPGISKRHEPKLKRIVEVLSGVFPRHDRKIERLEGCEYVRIVFMRGDELTVDLACEPRKLNVRSVGRSANVFLDGGHQLRMCRRWDCGRPGD